MPVELIYAPRAQEDLLKLPVSVAAQILDNLELLITPPWPPGKVKKLKGQRFWEIRTGDYRTLFIPEKDKVVILRIINRRDLIKTIKLINIRALKDWLESIE
ncbi:MAG: type II toxin-antitoxin system RelE/ParE family toxin [Armatimonadetes bacterium]|nr:type II toxin-antitoxin system RelE/ParE family toxin [Armatimonadota bacterium]